jgi:hypothetical protein
MALVSKIEPDSRGFRSLHPTQIVARYIYEERDGKKILQLNTYGSQERVIPDKLSQTLQFDEAVAKQLWIMLGKKFGFDRK